MKIAVDCHSIGQNLTGNETYIANVVSALAKVDTHHEYQLLYTPQQKDCRLALSQSNFRDVFLRRTRPVMRILFDLPRVLRKERSDMLWLQYVAPFVCPCPYVLVVHDISYEFMPQYFTKREVARFKLTIPYSVKRAVKIITGSEHSKNDLVKFYKVPPEKIAVMHYGVSEVFRRDYPVAVIEQARKKYANDVPYILYVGNIQPRKNLKRLLEAFVALRAQKKIHHKLVIVGKKAWLYNEVFAFIKGSKYINEIVLTGYLSDEELAVAYKAADFFVYPSLYEGFGLPVVEAMAQGIPVITSNNSSLREIARDAALLVNPEKTIEIQSAILALAADRALHRSLAEKSLEKSRTYSWDKTAMQTKTLFDELATALGKN